MISSQHACSRELSQLLFRRERWLYRAGLRLADRVVAQTREQQRLLRDEFGISADWLPSCGDDPFAGGVSENAFARSGNPTVLWAGRFAPIKRLEFIGQVARQLPDVEFRVAGAGGTDAYSSDWIRQAVTVKNIRLLGPVAAQAMPDLYRQAFLFLCTSSSEGFPNTFLEAWAHGVPTVSTVDPDGVIEEQRLGAVSESVDGVVAGIRRLLSSERARRECGMQARRYFVACHLIGRVVDRLETIIEGTLCSQRPGHGNFETAPGGRTEPFIVGMPNVGNGQ
jgi:glycosyltransferase involved in cell wall biosynthesis